METDICFYSASPRDVSAAENVGRVLAERCLESGITAMVFQPDQEDEDTPKVGYALSS